jgi:hypothetical protein
MVLSIHVQKIRETVEVANAEEALRRTKSEAAKRAPLLLRPVVNAMSDQIFAAEVVKRHNKETGDSDTSPATADDFLHWAVKRGYVTIIKS